MRYYDQKCLQCDGCYFHGTGNFPDGRPYECCRKYGYILHLDKGISNESCEGAMTPKQFEENEKMKQHSERAASLKKQKSYGT